MRKHFYAVCVLALATTVGAKPKIKESVTYSKSWEAAVAEAKMLNLPIVVHCHGFGWPPCANVHGSVLTNKKYIKFANENTVEVISMGKIAQGQEKGDKRLEAFEAKDESGNKVQYLAGWPNLTLDELTKLNQTCAKWNDTRGIPYTCVVNPHTQEKMEFISGGYASGKLMELVATSKKALNKQYGKSVSRKTLKKIQKDEAKVRVDLDKTDVAKAMTGWRTLDKKVAKQPDAIKAISAKLLDDILKVAGEQLEKCEELIGTGEKKAAAKKLGTLSRALKGTALEERANDLLAKAKAEA